MSMTNFVPRRRAMRVPLLLASAAAAIAPAAAQPAAPVALPLPAAATVPVAAAPAMTAAGRPLDFAPELVLELLDMMVANNQLTRAQADQLVAKAASRAAARQPMATTQAPGAGTGATAQAAIEPNTLIVPYVPESVRRQIKEEVSRDMAARAETEGWARPGELPAWVKAFNVYGDLRFRAEGIFQADGNATTYPNFAVLNAGTGFDTNTSSPTFVNPAFINTTEDRFRPRMRLRVGADVRITDWISGGFRFATGADNQPVSTNQTLGNGTNFGKFQAWIDLAYIELKPLTGLQLDFGRFRPPPARMTLIFDPDVNFDGAAARYGQPVSSDVDVFASAGAYPVFSTALDFGSNSQFKTPSRDKYLLAGQIGATWHADERLTAQLAVGYNHFVNVEGELSSLCSPPPTSADSCDTDSSRPQFQQFGNTMFPIRNIAPLSDPVAQVTAPQLQYFGLAARFHLLDFYTKLSYEIGEGHVVEGEAQVVTNLAFDRSAISARGPLNNFGPVDAEGSSTFDGGGVGWQARIKFATRTEAKPGDWVAGFAYRYLESDAVLDGLTDSDFHRPGTNSKGFILSGQYYFADRTYFQARWFSSDIIVGPPLSVDRVQLDLGTSF